MEKKRLEDMFSMDIDAYLKGIKRLDSKQSEEYIKLLELGKTMADKDFSKDSDKQKVFERVLRNINEQKGREDTLKKSNKTKSIVTKVASFALVCVLGFSLMQTSFAQGVVDKIVRTISLGHITILESEPSDIKSVPVPDKLKGKIFDKDGNPLEVLSTEHADEIYTVDGERIAYIDSDGDIVTKSEHEKARADECLIIKDPNQLNNYTCFDIKLPSYLPEGYKFTEAEFFKDENGVVENSKVVGLYFANEETGKFIYMQQRVAEEDAGYVTDAVKIEELKINGQDAVLYDDSNLDWEYNGVIYMLVGRGEIAKDELIKIAESIK
ncbi:DUF4367 domain-containing protein [Tepidanaerobacter syntrophicus]|uniref:DUF4367 domain-containing protein n=1 Tax=Tepidanaerobacter syntrophicus TaxID=224999 RepID=UPI001BD49E3E|nr:DUF4367 domain-containing protein [Tepidanaerobacter syntrophicus]